MHQTSKKCVSAQKIPLLALFLAPLAACEPPPDPEPPATHEAVALTCSEAAKLTGTLVGGIHADLDWSANEMDCDSMRRPDDRGIRLRFTGDVSGERLSIIIAMPDLAEGQAAVEIPSVVTATVEGSGRFFNTPNLDSCWTEVHEQVPLADDSGAYAIDGALYCIAPLGEVNGDTAVTITDLSFASTVNWN